MKKSTNTFTKDKGYKKNNARKNNNGSRKSGRKGSPSSNPSDTGYDAPGSNDPSWYATDPALLRDAASIPYSWAVGQPLTIRNPIVNFEDYKIPGVCSVYLAPTPGVARNSQDPVNIAATAMYSFVRHANSGHANYEASDLMLYVLAMSQIYSYINFLQRAYGVATLYAQRNRYMPKTLLQSMSLDPNDVINNLANFRYGLNVIINKAASLAVPCNMTIFNRHAFLYQNIYTEGQSVKDQIYLYNPYGFFQYAINEDNGAGSLYLKQWYEYSDLHTVADALQYGNDMLDAILGDEDMNIMSGDILKAYGGNILKLQSLPEAYPLVPVYNPGVLEQIQNATLLQMDDLLDGFGEEFRVVQDITVGDTHLVFEPKIAVHPGRYNVPLNEHNKIGWALGEMRKLNVLSDRIITTAAPEASPEITMENTRLTITAVYDSTDGDSNIYSLVCGSEIAVKCVLYTDPLSPSGGYLDLADSRMSVLKTIDVSIDDVIGSYITDNLSVANQLAKSSAFRYVPIAPVYELTVSTSVTVPRIIGYRGEIGNYALLSSAELTRLHEAAILNQLAVPSVAKL